MAQVIDKVELVNKLADDIVSKRKMQLQKNNVRFIPRNFYASSIPDCTRQMVHSILDWDKKDLPDDGLLSLFESGKKEESNIIKMLLDLGFEVINQQNPIQIKNRAGEIICTGRIDGKIVYNGVPIPYEIKSMNDYSFQALNTIEDFENSPLHRKYIKQLQLYMFGNEIEVGMFIISNFRQIKVIPIYLNYELCEQIIQQLEKAWEYVKKKEYPDPISYNPKICDWCPWNFLCTKLTQNKPAEFINNTELESMLERRFQLEPAVKEYKELDEQIKAPFKKNGVLNAIVGTKFEILGRKQARTTYNTALLTDEEKDKIKEVKETIVYKMRRI
jgi:CRISPR/Cas system-associated exonuclease Cas4 (RecB family)